MVESVFEYFWCKQLPKLIFYIPNPSDVPYNLEQLYIQKIKGSSNNLHSPYINNPLFLLLPQLFFIYSLLFSALCLGTVHPKIKNIYFYFGLRCAFYPVVDKILNPGT